MKFFDKTWKLALSGAVAGLLVVLLAIYGNPANMAICVACFIRDSAGYGLAQWTYWSRKQELYDFAKSRGASIGDLNMQLDFLWQELNASYPTVMKALKSADSVKTASDIVLTQFERPADQSNSVKELRANYGRAYYSYYAD